MKCVGISLGDISEYANFVGFGLFQHFLQVWLPCANMSSLREGGGCVYFLKSARKRHFRNVWVWGGGCHMFQRSTTHWTVHTNMALHYSSVFTLNHRMYVCRRGPIAEHSTVLCPCNAYVQATLMSKQRLCPSNTRRWFRQFLRR